LSRRNRKKRLDNPDHQPGIPRLRGQGFFIERANLGIDREEDLHQGPGREHIDFGIDLESPDVFSFISESLNGTRPRIFFVFPIRLLV